MTKIDPQQIVDLSGITFDIRKLTCSICYCVMINPKKCSNRKCNKSFCFECINSSVMIEQCCPFCRLSIEEVSFLNCESNLNFVIDNMNLFCYDLECGNRVFKIDSYIQHLKNNDKILDKCAKCKNSQDKEIKKCFNDKCDIISCRKCNLLNICNLCFSNFCEKCLIDHASCNNSSNLIEKCNICNKSEFIEFCEICKKYFCKTFPCDSFLEKIKNCKNCNDISVNKSEIEDKKCIHINFLKCDKCFLKCCYKNIIGKNKCVSCKSLSCNSTFCTSKCKICSNVFCMYCFVTCRICKSEVCQNCCQKCDNCQFNNDNSYCCNECAKTLGLSMIKKCSFINTNSEKCNKKMCINCWKVCNSCSVILCENHDILCTDCDDSCCDNHLFICDICDNSNSNAKICSKNCVRKCEICMNTSGILCDKEIHPYVEILKCNHKMCSKCMRKCGKCFQVEKKNLLCGICCEDKINYCKFCKSENCNNCNKYCLSCNDYYCPHPCSNCDLKSEGCINCLIYNSQVLCDDCEVELEICSICSLLLFCSFHCYDNYSKNKNVDHLCNMFYCSKCSIKRKEENNNYNNNNNSDFLLEESSSSLTTFQIMTSNQIYIIQNKRKRQRWPDDKVNTECHDNCICFIF